MGREEAHAQEEKVAHEGGATRTKTEVAYHLIPPCGQRREARRWWLGSVSHGPNNWKGGKQGFIEDTLNHFEKHYNAFRTGDKSDDNLAAMRWACTALMWFEENKPEEMMKALADTR